MWSLLPRYHQALIVVVMGVLGAWSVSAVITWWTGVETPPYQVVSLVVAILLVVIVPIAERIWRPVWRRFPALNRIFFPDLNGTWTGELRSTWKDADGNELAPIPATVWIRQGLFSVAVTMQTGESRSHSVRCLLESDHIANIARVWYTYNNRPAAEVRHRSHPHGGAAWLEMDITLDLERLTGQYFTDRKTTGDIRLQRVSSDNVPSPIQS